MNIASFIGALSCFGSLIALIFIVIRTFIYGNPTSGWPSLVTIFLFVGGLQLLCLGIIGKYIGKIFLETKNRPLYFLKETEKDQENNDKIKVYILRGLPPTVHFLWKEFVSIPYQVYLILTSSCFVKIVGNSLRKYP